MLVHRADSALFKQGVGGALGRRFLAFPAAPQVNLWIHMGETRGDCAGVPGMARWVTVVIEGEVKAVRAPWNSNCCSDSPGF